MNTKQWKNYNHLVKSYLGNALHVLNQMTDTEMIFFTLRRLKYSAVFLAAFPSLLRKYIKFPSKVQSSLIRRLREAINGVDLWSPWKWWCWANQKRSFNALLRSPSSVKENAQISKNFPFGSKTILALSGLVCQEIQYNSLRK